MQKPTAEKALSNMPEPKEKLAVDAVLAISIKDRLDRRESLLREFAKTGLEIEFVLVDRDTEDPQRGCFTSHQKCAGIMLARGYKFALILEDDATLRKWSPKLVLRLNKYLKNNPELLFFGLMLGKLWLTSTWGLAKGRGSGTHAYVMSLKAAEKLLQIEYAGKNIDTVYRKRFEQFCIFPMIAEQAVESSLPSDIERKRREIVGLSMEKIPDYDWAKNRKKQFLQIIKNLPKTFFKVSGK